MSGIMSMLLGAVSSAAAAADEFFNRVTLLLNTGSTNGAQNNTFLDSSSNNFSITRNGNTTQGTFTPFSQTGWSNFFGASSTNIYNTSAALIGSSTSTFTMEAWMYMTADPVDLSEAGNHGSIIIPDGVYNTTTTYMSFGPLSNRKLHLQWFDGAAKGATYDTALNLNQWYHVAVVVNSNAISMYVNGSAVTLTGTTTLTNRNGTSGNFCLGGSGQYQFLGYLSNIRVCTAAVYTSAFTPSTTPLTTTSQSATGCILLTSQSNRFVDNSTNNYSLTVGGTSTSVQAFSPFAPTAAYSTTTVGGSGYFDGNGDYLSAASNAAFAVGANTNFTIEAWIYLTSAASSNVIYQTRVSGGLTIGFNAGALFIAHDGVANVATYTYSPPINTWIHIAAVRNGTGTNNTVLYVNGVSVGTGSDNGAYAQGAVYISYNQSVPGWFFPGYISGLRFVNGSAVYTAAFTPPTAPPTAITNTQLLLSCTNAGIYDAAAKNDLETVGGAQVVSPTPSKFGNSSMYFDGTGDQLLMPASQNFEFGTGNHTVECWVYLTATTGSIINYSNGQSTNSNFAWEIYQSSSSGIQYSIIEGGTVYTASSTGFSINAWNHVAGVRNGNTLTIYVNGTAGGTTATVTGVSVSVRSGVTLKVSGYNNATGMITGYVDDLRISKLARYTANFTPATAAFPIQ
jgi:hypothetical protein